MNTWNAIYLYFLLSLSTKNIVFVSEGGLRAQEAKKIKRRTTNHCVSIWSVLVVNVFDDPGSHVERKLAFG